MRELKFRAWFKDENQLIYFDFSDIDNGVITYPCPKLRFIDESIVEQYTGLHDKNGREIYESDIIRIDGGAETKPVGVVEMKDGCWGFVAPWNDNPFVELKYYIDMGFCSIEVIGNIHENPELLNA